MRVRKPKKPPKFVRELSTFLSFRYSYGFWHVEFEEHDREHDREVDQEVDRPRSRIPEIMIHNRNWLLIIAKHESVQRGILRHLDRRAWELGIDFRRTRYGRIWIERDRLCLSRSKHHEVLGLVEAVVEFEGLTLKPVGPKHWDNDYPIVLTRKTLEYLELIKKQLAVCIEAAKPTDSQIEQFKAHRESNATIDNPAIVGTAVNAPEGTAKS